MKIEMKDGIKVVTVTKKTDCEELLGKFLDESYYDLLVDEPLDFHYDPFGRGADDDNCCFKFRPNHYTQKYHEEAYIGLRAAAKDSSLRGLAAGPRSETGIGHNGRASVSSCQIEILEWMASGMESIDGSDVIQSILDAYSSGIKENTIRGNVWLVREVGQDFLFDTWLEDARKQDRKTQQELAKKLQKAVSNTTYANSVMSGIVGYFGRYPRIPYGRPCVYTETNYDDYIKCYPLMKELAIGFKNLLPSRYENQMKFINKLDPKFVIPETPFTTITVNRTFRTAAHRDAGDLTSGFSNLTVVDNGKKWSGGYLILPEFRAAIAIRPGDLLLIANHDWIHGNTEIVLEEEGAERVSLVAYAREDMGELGEYEYEVMRRSFVSERQNNTEHPAWKPLFNGVTAGMWSSEEWWEYAKKFPDGEGLIQRNQPSLYNSYHNGSVSLDSFFE